MSDYNMEPAEVVVAMEGSDPNPLGATLWYPQDRLPLLVISTTPTGKTIKYVGVRNVGGDTGHQPARFEGPFPVWDHTYTEEELLRFSFTYPGSLKSARWSDKSKCYMDGGTRITVGKANLYRNYSY